MSRIIEQVEECTWKKSGEKGYAELVNGVHQKKRAEGEDVRE